MSIFTFHSKRSLLYTRERSLQLTVLLVAVITWSIVVCKIFIPSQFWQTSELGIFYNFPICQICSFATWQPGRSPFPLPFLLPFVRAHPRNKKKETVHKLKEHAKFSTASSTCVNIFSHNVGTTAESAGAKVVDSAVVGRAVVDSGVVDSKTAQAPSQLPNYPAETKF
ncbi:hypothetical protein POVWA2_021220 [Plasmodium ovale wallikeri]|uniref:Uncharacterized protein n=1 Tax=Plasmodium ovale wallikeri TaxID=864142 RepID=A0A1A8YRW4_PLAOA|nr:hypothetical protein POVWA1_021250 [Plasmodium ovale wallikeri]SBT34709.1 hypothetical protein POVWA2_021220 [Plasmodium ovale wallikeri]